MNVTLPLSRLQGAPPDEAAVRAFRDSVLDKLVYHVGGRPERASARDWFVATALAARDRAVDLWREGADADRAEGRKTVCYLSMEFLIGRLLSDALGNLGLDATARAALDSLGVEPSAVFAAEPDAALGNGGLGRLAACFMESMASVDVPAYGYGIRYENGLFRQAIVEGEQRELPEDWLSLGNPWEFERSGLVHGVGFGGEAEEGPDGRGAWRPAETVRALAYDTPVVGWRGRRVNTLRLWSARATDPLSLDAFNRGDHLGAQEARMRAEAISRVLYPGDDTPAGQELRLRQEFFFASASLQDVLRRHLSAGRDLRDLPRHAAVQLNDTHPAIGVAELMRLLVDLHGLPWGEAWEATRATFSYTNHTLLPEALESWPVSTLERLLPRHLAIVYRLNAEHLAAARSRVGDAALREVSLVDERDGRRVRMGHLAFLGSHRVNGVSALHTGLMRETVFAPLDRALPGRIVNQTNGITFRRWLHRANPGLTALLVDALGPAVLDEPERLEGLAPLAGDAGFRERFAAQRADAKRALSALIAERLDLAADPAALFDVQIKRIHEYKRQLLNVLHAVALYREAREGRAAAPRLKILSGKAAASYRAAKVIIRLAHDVARVVNADASVRSRLRVAFLPNYNVSLAEAIIPASDLSEQISTAGMEASGTGNMKLALNGALTIGTLDGANVEIAERVGREEIFVFGLTAEEAGRARRAGHDARASVAASPALAEVLDAVASGAFSPGEPDRHRPLVEALLSDDRYLVTADFDAYLEAQRAVERRWAEPARWWRSAVLNTSAMGWFSSDRTIRGYADEIWDVPTR